jgi:hypothetical protein
MKRIWLYRVLPFLIVFSTLRWFTDTMMGGLTWFMG